MLFRREVLDRIRAGQVTVAFRRWTRPTVSEGGTLRTPAGVLVIDELTPVADSEITTADARSAGFETVDEVLRSLRSGGDRRLYRIRFRRVGDDPRPVRRAEADLGLGTAMAIDEQFARWDAASRTGPWTHDLIRLVAAHPGESSRVLCGRFGTERSRLKRRVRQLGQLGLTESLPTGYRLSPRGEAYLRHADRFPSASSARRS